MSLGLSLYLLQNRWMEIWTDRQTNGLLWTDKQARTVMQTIRTTT